jgi:4,5-DOPA dioxygenase extradiol
MPSPSSILPVVFAGHGSPMNAIEDNPYSRKWADLGKELPRPKAVLCISAHWETRGTGVTAMERPRTIHDFGGFPAELYRVLYPAPGSAWLADEVQKCVHSTEVEADFDWGLDHGCWSVVRRMYPEADIPVVQLSMDTSQPAQFHYDVGRELAPLRRQGVLIVGSGNMVHNLRLVVLPDGDFNNFNRPFGLDWALEASALMKKLIDEGRHADLINYPALGRAIQLAVPTPEHYLPMLYALALKEEGESLAYFNDVPLAGSLTMTGFVIR